MPENLAATYFIPMIITFFVIMFLVLALNLSLLKLAFRNFTRKKTTTILVILGSMMGSSLIVGSLLVNDSFNRSADTFVDQKLGQTEAVIYASDISNTWNIKEVSQIYSKISLDFDRFLPVYYRSLTVQNKEENITKNDVIVTSFDFNIAKIYQPQSAKIFDEIGTLKKDEIVISSSISKVFKVKEGDKLNLNLTDKVDLRLKVKKIIDDNGLIGFNLPLSSKIGIPLGSIYINSELSSDFGAKPDESYNLILLSTSSVYDRDQLVSRAQTALIDYGTSLQFDELKQNLRNIALGGSQGVNFGQILLITSLFSVLAGLVLIINLFYMITEERRVEVGTLRAIGYTKSQISKLFAFEGLLYIVTASVIGSLVGILVGILFVTIVKGYIQDFFTKLDLTATIDFYFNIESLIFGFGASLMITFVTMLFTTFQISSLNIVSSLKDLKAIVIKQRSFGKLFFNVLALVLSSFILITTLTGSNTSDETKAYVTYFFSMIIIISIGFFAGNFYRKSVVYSMTAALIIIFTLSINFIDFFKSAWAKGPYLFLANSVTLLVSIAVVIAFNLEGFVSFFKFLFKRSRFFYSNIRIALKYPIENRWRSILAICTFGIVFFIVTIVSILRGQINQIIGNVSSTFDIIVIDQNSSEDISNLIVENSERIPDYKSIYKMSFGVASFSEYKYSDFDEYSQNVPFVQDKNSNVIQYISSFDFEFLNTISIDSPYTLDEIKTKLNQSDKYILLGQNFGQPISQINIRPDLKTGDKIKIKLSENTIIEKEVLGIIISNATTSLLQNRLSVSGLNGILFYEDNLNSIAAKEKIKLSQFYGINLTNSSSGNKAGEVIRTILKDKNISNIIVFQELVERGGAFLNQLIVLLQGFLSLGLIIGLAGMAIVQTRSIRERHQEIGTMLALGYRKREIKKLFITESVFIAFLGLLLGFLAGIFSAYNFYKFGIIGAVKIDFKILYGEISLLMSLVLVSSIFFSWLATAKVSKVSPVEAIKFIE